MFGQVLFLFVLANLCCFVHAVDRSKFRTCDDTSFCKKYRHFSEQEREVGALLYVINENICIVFSYIMFIYPSILLYRYIVLI